MAALDFPASPTNGQQYTANGITYEWDTVSWNSVSSAYGCDLLSDLTSSEISVATTATLTISKMHVCSGTTSDYTVTLPAASGNTGKLIGIRISTACTKLITVDGNSTETIDGAANRIMWAGESAILLCDGSNWFKIAGKSIPMYCRMRCNSDTSVTAATNVLIPVNATVTDNSGLLADTSNTRINIVRSNTYSLSAAIQWETTGSGGLSTYIFLNSGVSVIVAGGISFAAYATVAASANYSLSAGDYLRLYAYNTGGGNTYGSVSNAVFLECLEEPSW